MPFLSEIEPDSAGIDPAEASRRYGLDRGHILMMSRNENPYGPSPKVWEALRGVQLHRYPDSWPFLDALSGYTGYPEENIVTGAGMDEVITTVARLSLGKGDRALIPIPTYTLYSLAVRLCGANPVYQQRMKGFEVAPNISEGYKLIFLCSPNNPTGNTLSEETVRSLAEGTEGIIFLDEAYVEFADKSLIKMVGDLDNLIIGRTFSKAFGLAGLRLGYAVAPDWIAEQYRRVSPLFSISVLSLAAGVAALADLEYMKCSVSKIRRDRDSLQSRIEGTYRSQGNFLYIETPKRSAEITEWLLERGIVVRDCSPMPGAGENHIRVTIGTPEQNERFLEAYSTISAGS